jgi:predicted ATP-grasp superfamily ATP-dependent carboligase
MEVMLQEYIPGDDVDGVNYNSYCCDGKALVEFTAQKVRMSPPEFGVPAVVVSKDVPDVLESGRRLLDALRYTGYACTEFRRDTRDRVYKLMEINPRHNRSLMLAVKCGINFPLLEYRHLVGGRVPSPATYTKGIYWIDSAKDIAAIRRYRSRGQFSLVGYVRPYLRPHVFATLDLRDPVPFLKRCVDIVRMACKAVFKLRKPKGECRKVLVGADT